MHDVILTFQPHLNFCSAVAVVVFRMPFVHDDGDMLHCCIVYGRATGEHIVGYTVFAQFFTFICTYLLFFIRHIVWSLFLAFCFVLCVYIISYFEFRK